MNTPGKNVQVTPEEAAMILPALIQSTDRPTWVSGKRAAWSELLGRLESAAAAVAKNPRGTKKPDTDVKRIPVLQDEEVIVGDEVVVMTPVSRTPVTKARLSRTYKPGGPALAPYQRVYSVGLQASDAIQSLGDKIGWGKLDNFHFEDVAPGTGKLGDQWFCRFTADGTSMKAGGRFMPGGVILDWWK